MEKIKSNEKRYFLVGIFFSIFLLVIYYFFSKNFNFMTPILLLLFSFVFSKLVVFLETVNEPNGVYFSHDGLYGYEKGKLISKISWEDLEVREVKSFFQFKKSMYFKIYSKKSMDNPFNISLDWFVEESFLKIAENYVPKNHLLFQRTQNYIENNKLKT